MVNKKDKDDQLPIVRSEIEDPLKIAKQLRKDLQEIDVIENRQEVLAQIRDQFLASRMEAASVQEQVKTSAILELLKKIESGSLSTQQLLKIVEVLDKGNEASTAALLGTSKGGGGTNININNGVQPGNMQVNPFQQDSLEHQKNTTSIKEVGFLIEALKGINSDTIDGECEVRSKIEHIKKDLSLGDDSGENG